MDIPDGFDETTLDDGTHLDVKPSIDPETYDVSILSPDNNVIYHVAHVLTSDILNNKTIVDALNAHGFTAQAASSAIEKVFKANVDIPIAHNIDLDVAVDARPSNPGIHAELNIKF